MAPPGDQPARYTAEGDKGTAARQPCCFAPGGNRGGVRRRRGFFIAANKNMLVTVDIVELIIYFFINVILL